MNENVKSESGRGKRVKVLVCPYCGDPQPNAERCRACNGLFEPLSRQATHNQMGPWYVRDPKRPFQPGCSYETLLKLIDRSIVTKYTILRGPTTKQYWTVARHVPGIAHLLGYCHNCDASVDRGDHGCHACGEAFGAYLDRNYLGLPEIRPLPWEPQASEDDFIRVSRRGESTWDQPAMTTRQMSSFVTDEELFDQVDASTSVDSSSEPYVEHQIETDSVATDAAADRNGVETSLAHDTAAAHTSDATMRALQRRLNEQQQTNRLLMIVIVSLLALLIGGAAFFVLRDHGQGAEELSAVTDNVSTAIDEATPDDLALPEAEAPEGIRSDVRTLTPGGDTVSLPEGSESQPAEAKSVPSEATGPYAAEYDRALRMLKTADDESRSIEDRLADYDAALQILANISMYAPQDEQPADLDALINRIRATVEELRMELFFEKPS